jgi:hypothetical protein
MEIPHVILPGQSAQPQAHCDCLAEGFVSVVLHVADQSATFFRRDIGNLKSITGDCKTVGDMTKVVSMIREVF